MYNKSITFEDYNGEKITEVFQFNLNESELTKWMTSTDGGYTLDELMQRLYQEHNGRKIMELFEDLLKRTYGKKSLDGRRFEKTEQIWNDFRYSDAYNVLFMELVSDAHAAAEFFNAIIPKDMAEGIAKAIKENPEGIPAELKDYYDENTGAVQAGPVKKEDDRVLKPSVISMQ